MEPIDQTPDPTNWWTRAGALPQIAICLFILSASWFLLTELASLLRPLLAATLLCYVVLPTQKEGRSKRSQTASIIIISVGVIAILATIGLVLHGNIVELNKELPQLTSRAQELYSRVHDWGEQKLPAWITRWIDNAVAIESHSAPEIPEIGKRIVKGAAGIVFELLVIALYMIFILLEAKQLTTRVHAGFATETAEQIRSTVERINIGISSYMRAKVLSSIILAVPITLILLGFQVKLAPAFGLLTFLCNFIPYVGNLFGSGLPILFGFLDLPIGWEPVILALSIFVWHIIASSFIEPSLLGKAVGLSPIVILISLTFWGLCWGIVGMLVAVPLTVAVKIVLSNIQATRGIAGLLGEDIGEQKPIPPMKM